MRDSIFRAFLSPINVKDKDGTPPRAPSPRAPSKRFTKVEIRQLSAPLTEKQQQSKLDPSRGIDPVLFVPLWDQNVSRSSINDKFYEIRITSSADEDEESVEQLMDALALDDKQKKEDLSSFCERLQVVTEDHANKFIKWLQHDSDDFYIPEMEGKQEIIIPITTRIPLNKWNERLEKLREEYYEKNGVGIKDFNFSGNVDDRDKTTIQFESWINAHVYLKQFLKSKELGPKRQTITLTEFGKFIEVNYKEHPLVAQNVIKLIDEENYFNHFVHQTLRNDPGIWSIKQRGGLCAIMSTLQLFNAMVFYQHISEISQYIKDLYTYFIPNFNMQRAMPGFPISSGHYPALTDFMESVVEIYSKLKIIYRHSGKKVNYIRHAYVDLLLVSFLKVSLGKEIEMVAKNSFDVESIQWNYPLLIQYQFPKTEIKPLEEAMLFLQEIEPKPKGGILGFFHGEKDPSYHYISFSFNFQNKLECFDSSPSAGTKPLTAIQFVNIYKKVKPLCAEAFLLYL